MKQTWKRTKTFLADRQTIFSEVPPSQPRLKHPFRQRRTEKALWLGRGKVNDEGQKVCESRSQGQRSGGEDWLLLSIFSFHADRNGGYFHIFCLSFLILLINGVPWDVRLKAEKLAWASVERGALLHDWNRRKSSLKTHSGKLFPHGHIRIGGIGTHWVHSVAYGVRLWSIFTTI